MLARHANQRPFPQARRELAAQGKARGCSVRTGVATNAQSQDHRHRHRPT
jgi:hypothetical protein